MSWIDEAEARCAAATLGPWSLFSDAALGRDPVRDLWAHDDYVFDGRGRQRHNQGPRNLEFSAHARTDLPRALKALRLAEKLAVGQLARTGMYCACEGCELSRALLAAVRGTDGE